MQNISHRISHERHDATPRRLAHNVAHTASIALLCRHKQVEAHETVLVSGDDVSCLYIVLLGIINERSGDACCETTKQAPVPCVVRTSSSLVVWRCVALRCCACRRMALIVSILCDGLPTEPLRVQERTGSARSGGSTPRIRRPSVVRPSAPHRSADALMR